MALSFNASQTLAPSAPAASPGIRRRVLVTGAAGMIGSYFAEHAHPRYDLRLMVRGDEERIDAIRPFGQVVTCNLADLARLKELCQGIDTVLHLAASAGPSSTWAQLLPNNIVGTYNVMVAAKAAGCRRVVFASSVHAVTGYPKDVQVKTTEPVNPGDLYGVSKCFGEALGRYMAEQEGLSVIALRIGAVQPVERAADDVGLSLMDVFVSKGDLQQLIEKCIDAEGLRWAVFNGVSNNRFKRLDISEARELVGYDPQDDVSALHPAFQALHLSDAVPAGNVTDRGQQSGLREDL